MAYPCFLTRSTAASSTVDAREHLLVPDPAARVLVRELDELARPCASRRPITWAGTRSRDRDHPSADHEHAVVAAGDEALDHHAAVSGFLERSLEPRAHRPLGAQVQPDTASVVPVERLRHDGEADPLRRGDRLVLGPHDLAPRHGESGCGEQLVRHLLVAGDVDGERRRGRRHRRADPLLVLPLSELHERRVVQPDERDVAARGLVQDRLRRRSELPALRQQDQPLKLLREVELRLGLHQVVDQPDGEPARLHADVLLGVPVDHVVLARLGRRSASYRVRCARRTAAAIRAPRARRRGRATCRPRAVRGTRRACRASRNGHRRPAGTRAAVR